VYGLCVGGVSLAGNLRRGDVWRHMPRGRTRMQRVLHIGAGACTHRRIEADTACVAHAVLHSSCCAHGRIWPHTPRYGAIRQDSMHFLRRRAQTCSTLYAHVFAAHCCSVVCSALCRICARDIRRVCVQGCRIRAQRICAQLRRFTRLACAARTRRVLYP
jgi:hypothetical protein